MLWRPKQKLSPPVATGKETIKRQDATFIASDGVETESAPAQDEAFIDGQSERHTLRGAPTLTSGIPEIPDLLFGVPGDTDSFSFIFQCGNHLWQVSCFWKKPSTSACTLCHYCTSKLAPSK